MLYASGRRGQVLVLDFPDDKAEMRVSKELWLGAGAERLMVWGKFDDYIVGMIPAKELRKMVRAKGMGAMPDKYKSDVLKAAIDKALRRTSALPIITLEGRQQELQSLRGGAPGASG
jgi:hypothetical protein